MWSWKLYFLRQWLFSWVQSFLVITYMGKITQHTWCEIDWVQDNAFTFHVCWTAGLEKWTQVTVARNASKQHGFVQNIFVWSSVQSCSLISSVTCHHVSSAIHIKKERRNSQGNLHQCKLTSSDTIWSGSENVIKRCWSGGHLLFCCQTLFLTVVILLSDLISHYCHFAPRLCSDCCCFALRLFPTVVILLPDSVATCFILLSDCRS